MPMKNPPHPGRSIKIDCLEPLGLTVTEGAKVLGVARSTLSRVINGQAAITPEMAIRLAKAFGSIPETWLKMQQAFDLAEMRAKEDDIQMERYHPDKQEEAFVS